MALESILWESEVRQQVAANCAAVLVAREITDSPDLRVLATMFRIPWRVVLGMYREQVGEKVEARR